MREDWLFPPTPSSDEGPEVRKTGEEEEEEEESCGGFLHAALMTLRLLLRDVEMQHVLLAQCHALPTLAGFLAQLVALHFSPSDPTLTESHLSLAGPHPSLAGPHPSMESLSLCASDLMKELTSE